MTSSTKIQTGDKGFFKIIPEMGGEMINSVRNHESKNAIESDNLLNIQPD